MRPNGYIKLHRSILQNELFYRDKKAMFVFVTLLLLVDRRTGSYSGGRYMLSTVTGVKPMTCYRILKRLEKETMLKLKVNKDYTEITVVNWSEYQNSEIEMKRKRNANETQMNTLTRIENRELRKDSNSQISKANTDLVQVKEVFEQYIKVSGKNPNQYKLTKSRQTKIKLRLKDAGRDMLFRALDNLADSNFHNGENDRSWTWDLDFLIRSYENVEKHGHEVKNKLTYKADW